MSELRNVRSLGPFVLKGVVVLSPSSQTVTITIFYSSLIIKDLDILDLLLEGKLVTTLLIGLDLIFLTIEEVSFSSLIFFLGEELVTLVY